MSLKAKIEAVIYASEEPVTLQQLVSLLGEEAGTELDRTATEQGTLPLEVPVGDGDDQGTRHLAGHEGEALEAGTQSESDGSESQPGQNALVLSELQAPEVADTTPAEPADATLAGTTGAAEPVEASDLDAAKRQLRERERAVRDHIRRAVDTLMREYAESDRGIEIREVASGFRMATKPEYHDAVRGFVKSLKPALKLTLPALETLAVVAYKQPVTAAEISDIRGVDSAGVLGGLMARKLIATAGRKQVIGRPMLYKTTRDFLLRFGLKDVNELPSMDEFERMAGELVEQEDLPMQNTATLIEQANARGDAEHIRDSNEVVDDGAQDSEAEDARTTEVRHGSTDTDQATAETAAGGNHGRDNEPTQTAPLDSTQASGSAQAPYPEQVGESAGGTSNDGAEESERPGDA